MQLAGEHAAQDQHHLSAARDYRDLVIEELADSEAALLDQIVDLVRERDAYRLLAQQAIHALHDGELQTRRLRESLRLMREERRCRVQGAR
jgi:hypothetical protein